MLSVLVANIKGGCGKTTIATNLAALFAGAGHRTALADLDRQRSALGWIGRRPESAAPVLGLDWTKEIERPPRPLARLVIDAPAALRRKQIEDLVALADVILLPVQPGAFDESAARRFLERLEEIKAVARRKTPVAVVANRLKARTRSGERLAGFLEGVDHPVVARLRESQLYVESADSGLGLFELRHRRATECRADWRPLLEFLNRPAGAD
jgi:chromosome partitioning protein